MNRPRRKRIAEIVEMLNSPVVDLQYIIEAIDDVYKKEFSAFQRIKNNDSAELSASALCDMHQAIRILGDAFEDDLITPIEDAKSLLLGHVQYSKY